MNDAIVEAVQTLKDAANLLSGECRADCDARIASIERRLENPMLNLAVIGDFSCGKSTFINALLRRRLLCMDLQPTTAVPTYIRWTAQADAPLQLAVSDAQQRVYRLTDSDREAFERDFGVRLPKSDEQMIDAVTTDCSLSGRLRRVDVSFPYNASYEGICLIDTPGVNPGAEYAREHVRATQRVLSDEADAAIVLFPATQVFTETFRAFLEECTLRLLKNSIFIVTMADLAEQEDRQRLTWFVEENLKRMGVEQPKVYSISARMALNIYAGGETSPESLRWAEAFEAVIDEIFRGVGRRRAQIIQQSVGEILNALIAEVRLDVNGRIRAAERAEAALKERSPQRMAKACAAIQDGYIAALKAETAMSTAAVCDRMQAVFAERKRMALDAIGSQKNVIGLNQCLKRAVNAHMTENVERAQMMLREECGRLAAQYTEFAEQMKRCLCEYRVSLEQVARIQADEIQDEPSEFIMEAVRLDVQTETTVLSLLGNLFGGVGDMIEDVTTLQVGELFEDLFSMVGDLIDNVIDLFTPFSIRKKSAQDSTAGAFDRACAEVQRLCTQKLTELERQYGEAAGKMLKSYRQAYAGAFLDAERSYEAGRSANLSEQRALRGTLARLEAALERIRG